MYYDEHPFSAFVGAGLEFDPRARSAPAQVWGHYLEWCGANRALPVGHRAFVRAMQAAGFVQRRNGATRYWVGARLRDPQAPGYLLSGLRFPLNVSGSDTTDERLDSGDER